MTSPKRTRMEVVKLDLKKWNLSKDLPPQYIGMEKENSCGWPQHGWEKTLMMMMRGVPL